MTTQQHWTHWLGRFRPGGRVHRGARRAPDFADYGTAFGLDMSLSASAGAASPTAKTGAAVTGQPTREAPPIESPSTPKTTR